MKLEYIPNPTNPAFTMMADNPEEQAILARLERYEVDSWEAKDGRLILKARFDYEVRK